MREENPYDSLRTYMGWNAQYENRNEYNHSFPDDARTEIQPTAPELQLRDLPLKPMTLALASAMCEAVLVTSEVPVDKTGHPFIMGVVAGFVGFVCAGSIRRYFTELRALARDAE